ncbi:MAG: NAD(P)-dependent oxidoreductase [Smithellaceae bacterium]|nr:NAD(P)-dependent oxidoreductase [Smithellaceae bacterium]
MAKKKTVFLLGASGSMGGETFKELQRRKDRFNLVLLLRPSRKNKKNFGKYENDPSVKIIWGDIRNYDDVLKGVTGADYVLNCAAIIPAAADYVPHATMQTIYWGTVNIVNAIKAQPNGDNIKFAGIGSVAEIGDRLDNIHMARVGDPIKPAIGDNYSVAKVRAERYVVESGLKHWVWIRQTFITIPNTVSLMAPLMFHQPIETMIEFCTSRDSGRLFANLCEDDVPEDFWRRIYDVGGGPNCRISYLDLMSRMFKMLGLGDYKDLFERNWFARRNFHCVYWEDSHVLNDYLHFQKDTVDSYFQMVWDESPWFFKMGTWPVIKQIMPKKLIKWGLFYGMCRFSKNGPLYWMKHDTAMRDRITAFFGSKEKWEAIPDWGVDMPNFNPDWIRLDHGYDESKEKLELSDLQGAAKFRGGELLSTEWNGDMYTKLRWRCGLDHEFEASPFLVLKGGHWCDTCQPPDWNYDAIARVNPFFAQVWYPNHDKDENHYYDETCIADIL